jgi:predicted nucleic acid-binding Zn ribbon protein
MFRKDVKNIGELILRNLRSQGLETPLLQKRLVDAWPTVMGDIVAGYTQEVYIRNQTLWVHLTSPALRADLSMMKQDIVKKLNAAVGSQVIADIRFC